ncbi:hypothetical protein [Achromobacter anxifer]|uniref:hypothetical protein n=1 Tax=Achromobacter anxifer TaxID=1287737 RepID=UPI0023F761A7|nr:hypothetical protein [Achromobacter anxifer]MDF8362004.1 hypothetical protein [Achromobacter anxifer]
MSLGPQLEGKLSASADVKISPSRSHVLLVALCLLAALFFGGSVFFFYVDKAVPGFLFCGLTVLVLVAIWRGYRLSQKDQDREGGSPFTLDQHRTSNEVQTRLSFDVRSLADLEDLKSVLEWISTCFNRQPLPPADAMLDSNMQPIPNSKAAADSAVDATNEEARQQLSDVGQVFAPMRAEVGAGMVPPLDGAPLGPVSPANRIDPSVAPTLEDSRPSAAS